MAALAAAEAQRDEMRWRCECDAMRHNENNNNKKLTASAKNGAQIKKKKKTEKHKKRTACKITEKNNENSREKYKKK